MIVRLLLALLLAALAVPAAAAEPACHGGDVTMMAMHGGKADAPATSTPGHSCVGCVPLADWLGERIAAPILPATSGPVARIATFDPGQGLPPALPPPRQG